MEATNYTEQEEVLDEDALIIADVIAEDEHHKHDKQNEEI